MMRHGSLRLSMVDVEVRLGSSPRTRHPYSLSPLPCLGHSATSPATTGGWGLIIPTLSSHSQLCRNTCMMYENQNNAIIVCRVAAKDRLINIATCRQSWRAASWVLTLLYTVSVAVLCFHSIHTKMCCAFILYIQNVTISGTIFTINKTHTVEQNTYFKISTNISSSI